MVLSQRKIQLRRACWERIENHDTAVKVLATVNIEGNGRVSSVDASGSDAAVTACIRQQIKEWAFPATGAPTTARAASVMSSGSWDAMARELAEG